MVSPLKLNGFIFLIADMVAFNYKLKCLKKIRQIVTLDFTEPVKWHWVTAWLWDNFEQLVLCLEK